MIFSHTDRDGDKIQIAETGPNDARDAVWHVSTSDPHGAYLDRAAVQRLAQAAFRWVGTTTSDRILIGLPEPEVSYPDDGRRVAALKTAREVCGAVGTEKLIKVADWILGANDPGKSPVLINVSADDPQELARRIDDLLGKRAKGAPSCAGE